MQDKTVLITGSASGMGRIAAQELAARGARLILIDREIDEGMRARDEIRATTGNPSLYFVGCDLSNFRHVRKMAKHLCERYPAIDVLINNAGVTETERRESADGFEMTMATNFLAPYLLTRLLIDPLLAADAPRILNIASDAHRMVKTLDFDDIDNRDGWDGVNHRKGFQAYARSKLALVCLSYELAERLGGTRATVFAVSPGYFIRTNIHRNMQGIWRLGVRLAWRFLQDAERGAQNHIRLASDPEFFGRSGQYWEHCELKESSPASKDRVLWKRVFAYAEEATGVRWKAVG